MGLFRWNGSKKNEEKDFFSASIISGRQPIKVTEEKAMEVPAVKAAIELITNSIAALPLYLYEEVEENDIRKVENDDRVNKLNHSANKFQTAQEVKKLIVTDYLLYGRSYLYKKDDGSLFYLETKKMREENYTEDGFTPSRREFKYDGYQTVTLQEEDLIIIDSSSNGVLTDGGKIINQALNQLEYSSSLMENGALPIGVLKAASRLTEKAINNLRQSFENLYTGPKKTGKTMILEEGLDYQPISLKPDEMQLTESNKQVISDIARLFNLPESLINSGANKYDSLEANNIQLLQHTLLPIITQIEGSLDKYMLNDTEKKNGYYFRFDTSEIIRTTEHERIETVSKGLNEGLFSFNEARTKLDLPREEEDFHVVSMGKVLRYKNGQMVYLNLGQTNSTEVKELNGQEEKD